MVYGAEEELVLVCWVLPWDDVLGGVHGLLEEIRTYQGHSISAVQVVQVHSACVCVRAPAPLCVFACA